MKKQLTKWLINIATIASILWGHVCYADTPESKASQVYQQYRGKSGNRETLQQNFINPLMGGGSLRTIDNSKSGNVQLLCPGSKEFLTILIRPKGTGDFDADIYWDSNMDGKMDKSIIVTNVSGICTNGFISCVPGTWNNCFSYGFSYNNGNLTIQQTEITSLSGCFCVNNSCGSNLLWNNISYVLRLFGGAVAGAFQQSDVRYVVSEVLIDGTAIYFYGQQSRDCQVVSGGSGSRYPESFWNNPYNIQNATSNIVASESQDPSSFYSMLRSAYQSSNMLSQIRSCTIKRNIYSIVTDKYKSCAELGYPSFRFIGGWDANGQSKQCYYDNFYGGGACYLLSGHDWDWETCYSRISNHGNLLAFINYYFLPGTGLTAVRVENFSVLAGGNFTACWGAGDDASDIRISVEAVCKYIGCQVNEFIEDTCTEIHNNPSCTLYNETIDNVMTWRNGTRTGLKPAHVQCVVTCGEGNCSECGKIHCYEWISVNRDYVCSNQPTDLTYAKTRLEKVHQTSQYTGNEITFTDIRYQNNSWQTHPDQRFSVQAGALGDWCEKACRVKITTPPKTTLTGPQTKINLSPGSTTYYYRTCNNDICPAQEGEVVDIPCQCMNDFGAAATVLQSLRLAGHDMICSDGNRKTLPGY